MDGLRFGRRPDKAWIMAQLRRAGIEHNALDSGASLYAMLQKATDPLDHDGDGKKGGSLPHDPPALAGMTREELEAQAEKEGVDIEAIEGSGANGNVLVADIRAAIETSRGASA